MARNDNATQRFPQLRAQEKKLTFRANVDETIPNTLYGDDVNLTHIVMNLGSNAVKYTQTGTITLTVTWEPDPEGEDGALRRSTFVTPPAAKSPS